jgi:hypothetical protein
MADKPESFYDPSAAEKQAADAAPIKRGPGRPPKAVAEPALDVSAGVTADASFSPEAVPQGEETLEQAIERIRRVRKPFEGSMVQKLALPEKPGYKTHWFNDVAGRIDEASTSGWAHRINPRDGKPYKRTVGSGRDNQALVGYAMILPMVFWQEEMDARHKIATDKVEGIKKRPAAAQPGQAQASDAGKFYSPHDARGMDPIHVTKG